MPVVYDGAAGAAGANGVMSAFPTIYQWTGSSTPPTRPTTTSTYTWSTGAYTAPSGWASSAPSNTTQGNYLWTITYPLNVSATTTTSTLDWTDTGNPIRAIAYNGTVGPTGSSGAATFVITRTANDSSPPTNSEVSALLGRTPVAGDICTLSYNSSNNAIVYRYITSWTTFVTYITGSLIVSDTITGDKIAANTITGDRISANTITASKIAANTITASQIAASTISATNMAANSITAANGAIADATITTAKIGDLQVETLKIGNNAVTVPSSAYTAGPNLVSSSGSTIQSTSFTASGVPVFITISFSYIYEPFDPAYFGNYFNFYLKRDGTTIYTGNAALCYPNGTAQQFGSVAAAITDTPTSGSHTYSVYTNGQPFSGTGGNTYVSAISIMCLETKK
jgi:hypothetical protein